MRTFDVAVIGVGGMGSAACYHLSKAGLSVLGVDQFSIPNTRGSSHGSTRILRLGLHESTKYVPLVQRAAQLWDELGEQCGQTIFHRIGSLDVSLPDKAIFSGSLSACERCDIAHEVLDRAEIRKRHPALMPEPNMMAVFQPGSGFVAPEMAISAHVNLAIAAGAEIHGHERMLGWTSDAGGYLVTTTHGQYRTRHLIITAGAWIGKVLAAAAVPVQAERCVLGWFSTGPNSAIFSDKKLPVWIVDSEELGHFYGFPAHGIPGFKLGRLREIPSPAIDPDIPRREADREDEDDMRSFVREIFPGANGPVLSMETCFFENTPDRSPIIDRIPGEASAWVVGGFSGHGFKYSSAVGEIARDLILRGECNFDLTPFRLSRFSNP
ncbi:MAG: N-methyl-L-tryptophan oxidase [Verrucomicrobia bacterium]|nr:MAG: N-methyl-L-tryptophan oxidase [Verrucomicrobiota bacterium]